MDNKRNIALTVCISIIIASFLDFFLTGIVTGTSNNWIIRVYDIITPDNHPGFFLRYGEKFNRYLGLFFGIIGIIGLVFYFSEDKRNTGLLRFMLMFLVAKIVIAWIFALFTLTYFLFSGQSILMLYGDEIFRFLDKEQLDRLKNDLVIGLILGFVSSAFWVWLYTYAYKIFDKQRVLRTENSLSGDTSYFVMAEKTERFFNLLTDQIIVYWLTITILLRTVYVMTGSSMENEVFEEGNGRIYLISTLSIITSFFYYVVTESIFGRTPGKIITGTMVAKADGSKPGLLNILGRTLCRFIPFERFSFLFGYSGWHDSISNTYVLKDEFSKEENFDFEFLSEQKTV